MCEYEITTYNVGQGVFNLLREKNGQQLSCGIFDCGTIASPANVRKEDIIGDARGKIGNIHNLTLIVISHQDRDHWSWLVELLTALCQEGFDISEWNRNKEGNQASIVYTDGADTIVESCTMESDGQAYYYSCYEPKSIAGMKAVKWDSGWEYRIEILPDGDAGVFFEEFIVRIGCDQNGSYGYEVESPVYGNPFLCNGGFRDIDSLKKCIEQYIECIYSVTLQKMLIRQLSNCCSKCGMIENVKEVLENAIPHDYAVRIYMGGANGNTAYQQLYATLSIFGQIYRTEQCGLLRIASIALNAQGEVEAAWNELGIDQMPGAVSPDLEMPCIERNATSLMAAYIPQGFGEAWMFFPGDATVHSFHALNGAGIRNKVGYMVAPHHGSCNTNIVQYPNGYQGEQVQPVEQFVKDTQPSCVVYSAKYSMFQHPDEKVVKFMQGYEEKEDIEHTVCVNTDVAGGSRKALIRTKKYTFTTETNGYVIVENGNIRFESVKLYQKRNFVVPADNMFLSKLR